MNGKDYVTHAGLLAEAHNQGLIKLTTELVNIEKTDFKTGPVIVKATALMHDCFPKDTNEIRDRQFTAYGDASVENVNSNIAKHLIRMAETRAVNRCLRFATNIGMCSIEELESD